VRELYLGVGGAGQTQVSTAARDGLGTEEAAPAWCVAALVGR